MNGLVSRRASAAVVVGGVGSAALSQLLGRAVRLLVGMPFVPSVVVGFPRAAWLVGTAEAGGRRGLLTLMGLLEGLILWATGGAFPFALVVPAVSAAAADCVGAWLRAAVERERLLPVQGAVLNVTRVGTALLLWLWWGPPRSLGRVPTAGWLLLLVVLLTGLAGFLGGALAAALRPRVATWRLADEPAS